MRYLLRDILRDAIDAAKESGIWQLLTAEEKEDVVTYFLREYGSVMEEIEASRGRTNAA